MWWLYLTLVLVSVALSAIVKCQVCLMGSCKRPFSLSSSLCLVPESLHRQLERARVLILADLSKNKAWPAGLQIVIQVIFVFKVKIKICVIKKSKMGVLRIIRVTYWVTFHHFSGEPWHFREPCCVFTHTLLVSNPKHCHFGLSLLNSSRFTRLKRTDVLMQSKILSSNVFYGHLNLEQTQTVKINRLMSWLTVKYLPCRMFKDRKTQRYVFCWC